MHCLKYLADLPVISLRVCPVICAQSKIPYGSPIGDLDFVGYIWNTAAFYLGPYYPDFHALYMCACAINYVVRVHVFHQVIELMSTVLEVSPAEIKETVRRDRCDWVAAIYNLLHDQPAEWSLRAVTTRSF